MDSRIVELNQKIKQPQNKDEKLQCRCPRSQRFSRYDHVEPVCTYWQHPVVVVQLVLGAPDIHIVLITDNVEHK